MRKLIAVMTCQKNRVKADAQRATWVKDIREQGTDVVFFLGPPGPKDSPFAKQDEVFLFGVDDSYWGIPDKVIRICQWALENGYDYVAKCDDDVYIAPLRFAALPLGADYIGRFRGPHGQYPAHLASGFFYWLSAAACVHIQRSGRLNRDWMDERYVANLLALWNIYGYTDPVNYIVSGPYTSGQEILNRKILASGTVFCEYRANQMQEMHDALRFAEPVPGHPGLRAVPTVRITQLQFEARCTDRPPAHKVEL